MSPSPGATIHLCRSLHVYVLQIQRPQLEDMLTLRSWDFVTRFTRILNSSMYKNQPTGHASTADNTHETETRLPASINLETNSVQAIKAPDSKVWASIEARILGLCWQS